MRLNYGWLVAGLALSLMGCGNGTVDGRDASAKARVKPKSGQVWGQDLAQGLGLHTWELCSELGTVDCLTDAHLITLGGVEPTRLGIDEPLKSPSVSAPIAADRVAISACGERLGRDKAGPAVVFGPVLTADTPQSRREVAQTLMRRLLSRDGTEEELTGLVSLYDEIAPVSSNPVDDWSVGACVVVATSLEALFY